MLAILVIFPARLLPICTRDLVMLVQYQSDAMFKTLSCSIHVHSVCVDHSLLMFVMFYSYFSAARTAHWCHDNGGGGRIGETVVELDNVDKIESYTIQYK